MAVYSFRVGPYSRAIYLDGTKKFSDISLDYHQPVKEYAAKNFTKDQLDNALNQGWITEQQYNDTLVYISGVTQ